MITFQQAELGELDKGERVGGAQQHKRLAMSLQKQIEQQNDKLQEVCTVFFCLLWHQHFFSIFYYVLVEKHAPPLVWVKKCLGFWCEICELQ